MGYYRHKCESDAGNLNGFTALGIYATDTLINSSTTEYLSTLTLTTDRRNKTEVSCRARLIPMFDVSQPATIILFGEFMI